MDMENGLPESYLLPCLNVPSRLKGIETYLSGPSMFQEIS